MDMRWIIQISNMLCAICVGQIQPGENVLLIECAVATHGHALDHTDQQRIYPP